MNHSGSPELVAVAREKLLNEVFPSVRESLRYEVRMIASATGIAEREAKLGGHARQGKVSLFSELLLESVVAGFTKQEDARQAIAKAKRSREFDLPGQQQELQKGLLQVVSNALVISSPKFARVTGG